MLTVNAASPTPPYEQLRSQLGEMILAGSLPTGHRLPPIRQLAADLGLAPGTIARVYSELESAGLVVSRVRHGTVVAPVARPDAAAIRQQADDAARSFVLSARRLGLTLKDAVTAVRGTWDAPLDMPTA